MDDVDNLHNINLQRFLPTRWPSCLQMPDYMLVLGYSLSILVQVACVAILTDIFVISILVFVTFPLKSVLISSLESHIVICLKIAGLSRYWYEYIKQAGRDTRVSIHSICRCLTIRPRENWKPRNLGLESRSPIALLFDRHLFWAPRKFEHPISWFKDFTVSSRNMSNCLVKNEPDQTFLHIFATGTVLMCPWTARLCCALYIII